MGVMKGCTASRLGPQGCGWAAIYSDPPRETLKKRIFEPIELTAVDTAAS